MIQQRKLYQVHRQKNGIDRLNEATGWNWQGDGYNFDGYDWDGDKIAIVLADGNSFGALVKHSGQVYSATGDFDLILKFLKSNSQDQAE